MIIGIGIDTVEIDRFICWQERKNLTRVFLQEELDYCFAVPQKTKERLALRFAAKEAFFKAAQLLCIQQNKKISLLTLCRAVSFGKNNQNIPTLSIHWDLLGLRKPEDLCIHVSATHGMHVATVVVVLER